MEESALKQILGALQQFGEKIDEKLDTMKSDLEKKMDGMEQRMDSMDQRMNSMGQRMDQGFSQVNERLDRRTS